MIFKLANRVELFMAKLQGKGYGAGTVKKEIKYVKAFIKNINPILIDVGGNIGRYSLELRKQFPGATIYIFEPQRRNVNKLNSLFNDDDNIVILPYALSNSQSEVNLYSNQEGSGLASLLKRNLQHFKIPFELQEIVETLRFDDFYTKQMSNKTIDLFKIDIEGNELKVLKSLKVSLKHIKMLQFEFGGANIDARNYFQDFWYFFKDNKFDIFRITPLGLQKIKNYSEADEAFRTTNYLALNKSFFEF